MIDGLLIGIIVSMSVVATIFFLKFWRATREFLFLAFAFDFAVEGFSRLIYVLVPRPDELGPTVYIVRLIAYLLILAAIIHRNRKSLLK